MIKKYQKGKTILDLQSSSTYVYLKNPELKEINKRSPTELILERARNLIKPYSNYTDAVDANTYNPLFLAKVWLNKKLSNCTLTATQIIDPTMPIISARNIVNDPEKYNYLLISENQSSPGTLVIASEPDKTDEEGNDNKYHSMVLTGYADRDYDYEFLGHIFHIKKGEPLVHYSNGNDKYRKDVPLSVYNAMSEGKTVNRYYRHKHQLTPEVVLPTVDIVRKHGGLIPKCKQDYPIKNMKKE